MALRLFYGDNVYKAEIKRFQKIIGKQAIQIEILKNGRAVRDKVETVETLMKAGYTIKDAWVQLILRNGYYTGRLLKKPKEANSSMADAGLIDRIKEIKLNPLFWGYRRVRVLLVHREKIQVGKKKVKAISEMWSKRDKKQNQPSVGRNSNKGGED